MPRKKKGFTLSESDELCVSVVNILYSELDRAVHLRQPVQPRAIVPENFLSAFIRHTVHLEKLFHCMGKIGVAMGIVGGENDLVVAD